MNPYLIFILAMIALQYAVPLVVNSLNARHVSSHLPEEFAGWYDPERYRKAQEYLRENTYWGLIEETFFTVLTVVFIVSGGFNAVDAAVRPLSGDPILQGLLFIGIIVLAMRVLSLPFNVYHTFGIEAKYGFNRTTVATFISDLLKGLALTALLGGIALSAILWFFLRAGSFAWVYCWLAMTVFQLFLLFIAPVVIMPLFNKYTLLEPGSLKDEIEAYAQRQRFSLQGIFTMDGSRRSSKSNAFFTGFGRFRRIALFDTLIKNHTVPELVSVLAHEIGHYKMRHIMKSVALSIATSGVMFFVLSRFLCNPGLFAAFRMEHISLYAGLVFFGFLYAPLNMILDIIGNIISRRHEFAADRFGVQTYPQPEAFISALKKLSVHNLSNLTPHPWKVFLSYSHPPVLQRIAAIRCLPDIAREPGTSG